MSGDPARFLNAFAQALAAMALYRDGHPARERALDVAYQQIQDLQSDTAHPLFTFLGDEVVFGRLPLRELKAWDWGKRLAQAGIQRLEFEDAVSREDFEGFLDEEDVILSIFHHQNYRYVGHNLTSPCTTNVRFAMLCLIWGESSPGIPLEGDPAKFCVSIEHQNLIQVSRPKSDEV